MCVCALVCKKLIYPRHTHRHTYLYTTTKWRGSANADHHLAAHSCVVAKPMGPHRTKNRGLENVCQHIAHRDHNTKHICASVCVWCKVVPAKILRVWVYVVRIINAINKFPAHAINQVDAKKVSAKGLFYNARRPRQLQMCVTDGIHYIYFGIRNAPYRKI